MISPDQFAQAVQALWLAQIVAIIAFMWAASTLPSLTAFLLSRWPAYRAWKRKRARVERLEWATYIRKRREYIATAASQAVVDKSSGGVRW